MPFCPHEVRRHVSDVMHCAPRGTAGAKRSVQYEWSRRRASGPPPDGAGAAVGGGAGGGGAAVGGGAGGGRGRCALRRRHAAHTAHTARAMSRAMAFQFMAEVHGRAAP